MKALKKLIQELIPKKAYSFLRNQVIIYRQKRFEKLPKLSESQFERLLKDKFLIKEGSVVFIHSSMNKMNLEFDVFKLLHILKEVVGEEGTLLFPCTQINGSVVDYIKSEKLFNVRKSPTSMGLISEIARKQPGAKRSLHPTNSVVALGKFADELTKDHHLSIYPCGEHSPYFKITKYKGTIIGLGVTIDSLTFVHCVEDLYPDVFPVQTRRKELFNGTVIDESNNERKIDTLVAHPNIAHRNIRKYFQKHIPSDVCKNMTISGMNFFCAKSDELFEIMKVLSEQKIVIYSKKVFKEAVSVRLERAVEILTV